MRFDLVSKNDMRLRKGLLQSGMKKLSKLRPSALARASRLASEVEREQWLQPAVACRILPVQWLGSERRCQIGQEIIEGEALRTLSGASAVAVAFLTLGAKVDAATVALHSEGKALEAYFLGEIGLGALGNLTRRTEAFVRAQASKSGMRAGSPIFPGEAGLELSQQSQLFRIAEPARVGIELSASGMIAPVKSLSLLIGIGNGLRRWSRSHACQVCSSFSKCRSRCNASSPD